MVLQEMKATEERALVVFFPKQSLLGLPTLPKDGGPQTSAPSISSSSPLLLTSSDHPDLSPSSPHAPTLLLALELFTSKSYLLVFAQAVPSAWKAIPTFE